MWDANMENMAKLIIENNVLIKYEGNEKTVNVPEEVKEIAFEAFFGNVYVENVNLPDSLTYIAPKAFSCMGKNFKKIIIPRHVEMIDYKAFDCDSLVEVHILNPNISIHPEAFDHCYDLLDIYFSGTKEEWEKTRLVNEDDEPVDLRINKSVLVHYFD